jgi:hypothetical protein
MGSHKRDLLPGRIVEVGRGLHHKHRGVAVAKIEVSSGFYLCLLSGMVPNPSIEVPGIG